MGAKTAAGRRWWRDHYGLTSSVALERWDRRIARIVGMFALVLIMATAVGAALMVVRLYAETEPREVGNPLSVIFGSRIMVAGARLAILAAGVYVVVSILMHMRNGQWLTAAGPLKVAESVRKLRDEVVDRRDELNRTLGENTRLRASVSTLTHEVRTLEHLLERAQKELRDRPGHTSG